MSVFFSLTLSHDGQTQLYFGGFDFDLNLILEAFFLTSTTKMTSAINPKKYSVLKNIVLKSSANLTWSEATLQGAYIAIIMTKKLAHLTISFLFESKLLFINLGWLLSFYKLNLKALKSIIIRNDILTQCF